MRSLSRSSGCPASRATCAWLRTTRPQIRGYREVQNCFKNFTIVGTTPLTSPTSSPIKTRAWAITTTNAKSMIVVRQNRAVPITTSTSYPARLRKWEKLYPNCRIISVTDSTTASITSVAPAAVAPMICRPPATVSWNHP